MMMSKPAAPAKSEEPAAASAAKKPAAAAAASSAKKSPQDAVADLERRLAELTTHMPAPAPAPAAKEEAPPAAAAAAAAPPSSTAATARGGKNALLVRTALEEAFGRWNDPAKRLSYGPFSALRFVPSKRPSAHVLSSILPLVYVCSVPNALK
jgi:hypothetical protein